MPVLPLRSHHAVLAAALLLGVGSPACDKTTKPPPGESVTSPAGGGDAASPSKGEAKGDAKDDAKGDAKDDAKGDASPPAGSDRTLAVPDGHPLFGRYEGQDFPNDCKADSDCHAGGCGSEVCSADEGVITTCDVPPAPLPKGTQCGCVATQCRWWNTDGATLATPSDTPTPDGKGKQAGAGQGETKSGSKGKDCGGEVCAPPNKCVEYYGIAGPKGPKFQSCEIPCKPGKGGCPKGMKCTTVTDGPGSVCR